MTDKAYQRAGKGLIKRFAKLQQKKYRDRERLFLAEGLRTVTELLAHMPDEGYLTALFVEPHQMPDIPHQKLLQEKVFLIDPEDGRRLSGTSTAQGVVGIFSQPREIKPKDISQGRRPETASFGARKRSLVIALDDVQDPGNVGTIVRTAAWFGVSALLCGPGTADRYNPKAIRAGVGSIFCLNQKGVGNLRQELEKMQQRGYTVCCSTLDGTDFREYDGWPERVVLVIGNEANGVSKEVMQMADRHVSITHAGPEPGVESLNAAVSAGILLSQLTK